MTIDDLLNHPVGTPLPMVRQHVIEILRTCDNVEKTIDACNKFKLNPLELRELVTTYITDSLHHLRLLICGIIEKCPNSHYDIFVEKVSGIIDNDTMESDFQEAALMIQIVESIPNHTPNLDVLVRRGFKCAPTVGDGGRVYTHSVLESYLNNHLLTLDDVNYILKDNARYAEWYTKPNKTIDEYYAGTIDYHHQRLKLLGKT